MLVELSETGKLVWSFVQEFWLQILLVWLVSVPFVLLEAWFFERRIKGRYKNMKRGPELCDGIVTVIEQAVYDGTLNSQQSRRIYRELAKVCDLPELQPRHLRWLKRAIKARRRKANNTPLPLPVDNPSSVPSVKNNGQKYHLHVVKS